MTTASHIRKIAFLTGRDSPVGAVGVGSAGGHAVYMRELAAALAHCWLICLVHIGFYIGLVCSARKNPRSMHLSIRARHQ